MSTTEYEPDLDFDPLDQPRQVQIRPSEVEVSYLDEIHLTVSLVSNVQMRMRLSDEKRIKLTAINNLVVSAINSLRPQSVSLNSSLNVGMQRKSLLRGAVSSFHDEQLKLIALNEEQRFV